MGLGLLGPLIAGGVLLSALGGVYSCIHGDGYDEGHKDAEAENLRATIQAGREAQKGTTAAFARVSDDLAGEREKTAALTAEIDRLSLVPAAPPPQEDADPAGEPGVCRWDDQLPWPPDDAG